MSINNVALLGANGNLGAAVLSALLANKFSVTVLKRESSQSLDDYPSNVRIVRYQETLSSITSALQNQDAFVATINGSQTPLLKLCADACIAAGVRRFIPSDFGSCDSASLLTQELVPLYRHKTAMREYLIELNRSHPEFTWTSLVCGHFFDWKLEFLHLNLAERKADMLDDGATKFSISTLARVAEATAAVLRKPQETANRMLYVQSFRSSQGEILAAFERATEAKWEVTTYDSQKYMEAEKAKAKANNEDLVWWLGAVDADWTTRDGFAMELLGLEDEDLDTETKRVVRMLS